MADIKLPDFDQIAGEIIAAVLIERNRIDALPAGTVDRSWARSRVGTGTVPGVVADYLRQVWNARGAADLEAIHGVGEELTGVAYTALEKLNR